jgi:hypothetical protein
MYLIHVNMIAQIRYVRIPPYPLNFLVDKKLDQTPFYIIIALPFYFRFFIALRVYFRFFKPWKSHYFCELFLPKKLLCCSSFFYKFC